MAHRFRTKLEGSDESAATYALVPASTMAALEGRTRVPVRVTVNGISWRTTICNMGAGPMIGVTAAVRKAAGIERGDWIALDVERDTHERTVGVPADFAKALRAAERRAFDTMSYTHRKEYVQWIEDAKKPETRFRRIEKAREKLRERLTSKRS